jgi:hypothetical protein
VEPFPEVRVNVAGLDPRTAHGKIMDNARVMFLPPDPEHVPSTPADVVEQVGAIGEGIIAILERHTPRCGGHPRPWMQCAPGVCSAECERCGSGSEWPCDDFRDAARGLARGLPSE